MKMQDIVVRVKEPYPELSSTSPDRSTVAILKNLCNSRAGELKGILQYIYQSVIADKCLSEVANILEEIAIVEMSHLDMLMHAITAFGGDPIYEDAMGACFNASYVNYSKKLNDMLDVNIAGERKAIEDYCRAIECVENKSLKSLFARIIEDEKLHIVAFETIRDTVKFLTIN